MIGLANCQLTFQVFYEHLLLKEKPTGRFVLLIYNRLADHHAQVTKLSVSSSFTL